MGGRKDLITAGLTLGALAGAASKAKGKMSAIIATESGAVASFPDGTDAPVADLTAAIVPVQSGSGDPSPENIRPISGWTECNVTRTGKNLLPQEKIYLGGNNPRTKNIYFASPIPAGTYSVSFTFSGTYTGAAGNAGIGAYKSGSPRVNVGYVNKSTGKLTITGSCDYLYFYLPTGNYDNGETCNYDNFQLELGSAATAYEPYRGDTYTVTFGSAGTVYGGTLDVTTGKLTVTKANVASYAGETLPGAWISDRDVYAEGTTPTIGAQVVYELAAPIVYDLSPVEIRTLAGQNTIWADTGSVTVKYATTDTKAFVDKYIAARRNG